MKRKAVLFFLVIFCFITQNTVLKSLQVASVNPNLLLMITAGFGFISGSKEGMFVGFFCGLFSDIFYGDLFGYYILLYSLIGYVNGSLRNIFNVVNIKQPMFLIAGSDLCYGLIQYFVHFLLRGKFDFGFYFMNVILPEFLFTMVITLFFYPVLLFIDRELEKTDSGSEDDFV
ncbi:MAG: rod shape-determining protein MreD [Lachnospiraceae bacterium]